MELIMRGDVDMFPSLLGGEVVMDFVALAAWGRKQGRAALTSSSKLAVLAFCVVVDAVGVGCEST